MLRPSLARASNEHKDCFDKAFDRILSDFGPMDRLPHSADWNTVRRICAHLQEADQEDLLFAVTALLNRYHAQLELQAAKRIEAAARAKADAERRKIVLKFAAERLLRNPVKRRSSEHLAPAF